MKKRLVLAALSLLIVAATLFGCAPREKKPELQYKYFLKEYLGTVNSVYCYGGDDKAVFEENCARVEELLDKTNKLFDIYYEYAGVNNLRTLNKNAGNGTPIAVDPLIVELLEYGKEAYRFTGGKTNIAMGAVLSLWHECREDAEDDPENARLPDADALAEAAKHTDIYKIIIDKENSTVYLEDPLMSIDVGALAKGFVTDLVRDLLEDRGATSYLLNFGGNVVEIGGDGWEVPLANPNPESEEYLARQYLRNIASVTSGNYRRYFVFDGKLYHHLIDPDTLYPAEYHSSVTVICKSSALGDALSTALFCMPLEEGKRLIESFDGVEVIWVSADFSEVYKTEGFDRHTVKQ